MKSVLISIQPKWCELIASGKKTIEVRKTRPKIETPFKCYIYETKGKTEIPTFIDEEGHEIYEGRGEVIGWFICDNIFPMWDGYAGNQGDDCLTFDEREKYLQWKDGYGWHISNLVIYDKPKELCEFKKFCNHYFEGDHCEECNYFIDGRGYEYDESDCGCNGLKHIERPPQSWSYVEELEEQK